MTHDEIEGAAKQLVDPRCPFCESVSIYYDVALRVKDLDNVRSDERTARKMFWLQAIFELAIVALVLVLAILGVRSPIVYAAIVCVRVAFLFVATSFGFWVIRRAATRAEDIVLALVDFLDSDCPRPQAKPGTDMKFTGAFLVSCVRAYDKRAFPLPPEPVRGTDFDVPPLPPRPE